MKYLVSRAIAYILDCLICYALIMLIIQWAILSNMREMIGLTDEWFKSSWNLELYVLLTISLPVWLYFTYFDSYKSTGTIGKRITKLLVTNRKNEKIGLKKSFLRTLLKLAPWEISHIGIIFPIPLYFSNTPEIRILTIIGLILLVAYIVSIVVDSNKDSIYDKLLATRVIKK